MKKLSKKLAMAMLSMVVLGALTGCGQGSAAEGFDSTHEISVISREDGSGTRGAFVELFGIEEKDADGNKVDHTSEEAIIANKTDVMLTNVSGNEYAVGYVSLGSLNDSVKALKIDGAEANAANVKDGSYSIARPFNIATKSGVSNAAQDFINYILSVEGQQVVEATGYIQVPGEHTTYTPDSSASGKVVVAGSSSVTPVMEKLKEAYNAVNANVEVEIQESDSSTGMQGAIDGTCDIGMASRDLKESELETLTSIQIALDGIAVVINNENPANDLSKDTVRSIFTGEVTTWDAVK